MGAIDLAVEAAARATERAPSDASAWERLGRLRLRLMDRAGAISALEQARLAGPSTEGLLSLALASPDLAAIPVLTFTAFGNPADVSWAAGRLTKPLRLEALLTMVAKHAGAREPSR